MTNTLIHKLVLIHHDQYIDSQVSICYFTAIIYNSMLTSYDNTRLLHKIT